MEIHKNPALKILFISNGIFVFAECLLGPLFAVFAQKIDASVISVSFAWFTYMVSATLFSAIMARLGDKIKEKEYLLVAGYVLRIICWILYIFTTNIYMFIGIQILLGLGLSLGSPAFNLIFAEHITKGRGIYEYSSSATIMYLAIAFSSLIGGVIVAYFGFDILFMIMAILATASSIIVLAQPRELL